MLLWLVGGVIALFFLWDRWTRDCMREYVSLNAMKGYPDGPLSSWEGQVTPKLGHSDPELRAAAQRLRIAYLKVILACVVLIGLPMTVAKLSESLPWLR